MRAFYNFQSYPNTYYTKLRGTPPKIALVTPKSGLFSVQLPCDNIYCFLRNSIMM